MPFLLIQTPRSLNIYLILGDLLLALYPWLSSQLSFLRIKSLSLIARRRSWCGLKINLLITTFCTRRPKGMTLRYVIIFNIIYFLILPTKGMARPLLQWLCHRYIRSTPSGSSRGKESTRTQSWVGKTCLQSHLWCSRTLCSQGGSIYLIDKFF